MKIAFICTEKLPSPAIKGGAIQLMIDGIAPYFAKKHLLTIYSIEEPQLPAKNIENGIQYVRFPQVNYYNDVVKDLSQHSFDLIHIFNRPKQVKKIHHASPNSIIITSLHNDMFSPLKIAESKAKEAIQYTNAFTTVSEYIKRTLTDRYPKAKEKTTVVYSGVDINNYPLRSSQKGKAIRQQIRNKLQIDEKKVILFVGRLSKTKGPDLLIKAMYDVIKEHPSAVLVIVGGKWFSDNGVNDYVRSLYELATPIKNHILFTNFVPSKDIPNILLAGDVLVCSSRWHEPLARIHYEAMAAQLPIITTNRGGNAEVIFHDFNGLVIDHYYQVESFTKCINFLLNSPELCQRFGKNGRLLTEMNFKFEHTATRLESVYEKAMKQK